ncbi:MAG: AI-2E family transporter [Acidobacteriota bacterium]
MKREDGVKERGRRLGGLSRGAQILLTLACTVVIIAGLRAAADILQPFVLSIFLAVISLPLLAWLQEYGVPRVPAVLLTLMAVIGVGGGVVALVAGSSDTLTREAPKYQQRIETIAADIETWVVGLDIGIDSLELSSFVNADEIVDLAAGTLRGVAGVLSNTVLVLLTLTFMLFEAAGFIDKIRRAFGNQVDIQRLASVLREVQHYLAIKTLVSLATGLAVWLWMLYLGVDFPMMWGLVAFLFNYIPTLGSIFAAVPATLLAVIQMGVATALATALGYLVINVVVGNFIEPNLMGRRFGLSTLVVFASLVFWGWVWGPIGMLLSVPLTMIFKILMENSDEYRWVAVLLGKNSQRARLPFDLGARTP